MSYTELSEIPAETLADPDAVLDLIEDEETEAGLHVALARGLYWHCADYHEGQSSRRYEILSTLDYRPSPAERGPEPGSDAAEVYELLGGAS